MGSNENQRAMSGREYDNGSSLGFIRGGSFGGDANVGQRRPTCDHLLDQHCKTNAALQEVAGQLAGHIARLIGDEPAVLKEDENFAPQQIGGFLGSYDGCLIDTSDALSRLSRLVRRLEDHL